MEWKDLAPWIAIAVTLILSILVPLFTQIANNRFQSKKLKQEHELDIKEKNYQKCIEAYENFLKDVGAAIEYRSEDVQRKTGSSIGQLYLYVPSEIHKKLDALYTDIRKYHWEEAESKYFELAKLVYEEYEKIK